MSFQEEIAKIKLDINPFTEPDAESLLDIAHVITQFVQRYETEKDFKLLLSAAITTRIHIDCWLSLIQDLKLEVLSGGSDLVN